MARSSTPDCPDVWTRGSRARTVSGVSARLTVTDHGFKALIARGKTLKGTSVKAGFFVDHAQRGSRYFKPRTYKGIVRHLGRAVGEGAGLTNIEIARILSFGSRNIPPRNFMALAIRDNRRAWVRALMKIGREVLAGKTTMEVALATLGQRVARDIQRAMKHIGIPDAASTLGQKSGSTPLIDSHRLIEAVSSQVVG